MKKRDPSCTVGGNVILMQPLWRTLWRFLKNKQTNKQKTLKIELSYDPIIPLQDIYPEKNNLKRHMHLSACTCSTIYNSQDMEAT